MSRYKWKQDMRISFCYSLEPGDHLASFRTKTALVRGLETFCGKEISFMWKEGLPSGYKNSYLLSVKMISRTF